MYNGYLAASQTTAIRNNDIHRGPTSLGKDRRGYILYHIHPLFHPPKCHKPSI